MIAFEHCGGKINEKVQDVIETYFLATNRSTMGRYFRFFFDAVPRKNCGLPAGLSSSFEGELEIRNYFPSGERGPKPPTDED